MLLPFFSCQESPYDLDNDGRERSGMDDVDRYQPSFRFLLEHLIESILAYTPYDTYVRVLYIGEVTCST